MKIVVIGNMNSHITLLGDEVIENGQKLIDLAENICLDN